MSTRYPQPTRVALLQLTTGDSAAAAPNRRFCASMSVVGGNAAVDVAALVCPPNHAAAIAPLLVAIAVHASLLVWRSYYMNKQPPQVVALDTEILDTRRHQKTVRTCLQVGRLRHMLALMN